MRRPQPRTHCKETNSWALGCSKAMLSPQRRTHCQENEIPGKSKTTRQCAALSSVHIAKTTKCLGNRLQQDNAQPSAAYTLPRNRNPWAIECNKSSSSPQRRTHCQENENTGQSKATRQCAALSSVHIAKTTKSLAIECNKTLRSPQRRTHCQENEMLGSRMLRRQCADHSGAHIAKKNEMLGQSNATRLCAALSGVHIAKKTTC